MEHPAITREQVEAMDETMTFSTRRVTQMHRRNELSDHFAPGVIEGHRPRMTTAEKVLLVLIYAASLAIVSMVIGWGYEEISRMDWQAVAQLLGVKR